MSAEGLAVAPSPASPTSQRIQRESDFSLLFQVFLPAKPNQGSDCCWLIEMTLQ